MGLPNRSRSSDWPELPFGAWSETAATLHMWTQIVGKVRLVQTPWTNHSWHVPLYLTARGLSTSPIPHGGSAFERTGRASTSADAASERATCGRSATPASIRSARRTS